MKQLSQDRLGGIALIMGSLLFAIYAVLIAPLFQTQGVALDFIQVVRNPYWRPLAFVALVSSVLMIVGFYAVYSRLRDTSGLVGTLGFLFTEAAYFIQACKVTWELFLYPVIASHPESAFLFRERLIIDDPFVRAFNFVSAAAIALGTVLFCLTLARSKEYPKAAAMLIFAGAAAYAVGPILSIFVAIVGVFTLSLGCLLLGIRLLHARSQ